FDPQKLWAFQDRHMRAVPLKQKVPMCLSYLQRAGLISSPPPCDTGPHLMKVIEAAGDRIKTAGDILSFTEFFVPDDHLKYDEKDFEKGLKAPGAADLLRKFRDLLASADPFEPAPLEEKLKTFVAAENIKIGQIIQPLRVATTGKT